MAGHADLETVAETNSFWIIAPETDIIDRTDISYDKSDTGDKCWSGLLRVSDVQNNVILSSAYAGPYSVVTADGHGTWAGVHHDQQAGQVHQQVQGQGGGREEGGQVQIRCNSQTTSNSGRYSMYCELCEWVSTHQ